MRELLWNCFLFYCNFAFFSPGFWFCSVDMKNCLGPNESHNFQWASSSSSSSFCSLFFSFIFRFVLLPLFLHRTVEAKSMELSNENESRRKTKIYIYIVRVATCLERKKMCVYAGPHARMSVQVESEE